MRIKLFSMICLTSLFLPVFADAPATNPTPNPSNPPVMNDIQYQITLDNWANTSTARVVVAVNASLTEAGLSELQSEIQQNLLKIANSDWHITQFNRSQDQSGLEQITVLAETRLPANELAPLRNNAKAISKPGNNYAIADIQFTPSLAGIANAQQLLRNSIYTQVNSEIANLDKQFPGQHFYVHQLNFESQNIQVPQPMMFVKAAAGNSAESSAPMTVSNKVTLTADVDLASGN